MSSTSMQSNALVNPAALVPAPLSDTERMAYIVPSVTERTCRSATALHCCAFDAPINTGDPSDKRLGLLRAAVLAARMCRDNRGASQVISAKAACPSEMCSEGSESHRQDETIKAKRFSFRAWDI
ncbi:jg5008 [Pararge aegeria aegeria]|uniref:Jg5008 protein n=1 Tax=Pararge aegeria aegeria TaxID=348720 RepID=A0A8S4S2F7_9NEOP|nr:jg5008 [Pararge aegeria aegeria]